MVGSSSISAWYTSSSFTSIWSMYDDGAGRDDIVEGGKLLSVKFEWKKTFRYIGISEKVPIIFGHL